MAELDQALLEQAKRLILRGRGLEAVQLLQPSTAGHDPAIRLLLGDAQLSAGDLATALTTYESLATNRRDQLDPAVAYRIGRIHHLQGEPQRALAVYASASSTSGALVDKAWLSIGVATAHWLLGNAEEALAHARAARAEATISGDAQVKAAAHIVMGLVVSLSGDPSTVEEEYARAAHWAAEAGDLAQAARIGVLRSHHLLADARFIEAADLAGSATAVAEELGSTHLLVPALVNEAEARVRLGQYGEAVDRCERLLALSGRLGTKQTAAALLVLAQVRIRRGAREQARAALEQALRLHAETPDRQVRVPALAALARLVLVDDAEEAARLAAEALAEATGSQRLPALLASGWTALARGKVDGAERWAIEAVEHARRRRERAWLAEALELRASTLPAAPARAALREALQVWQEGGALHDADRVLVRLAALAPTSIPDRRSARSAEARLLEAGVADWAGGWASRGPRSVEIVTYGRLEVLVDGLPVPAESWQSKRARDLLRLLVCRRGRAVPRLEVCEALWPDEDPDKTSHRLSVLLSIIRGVLGADALITSSGCVGLDRSRVDVDVEAFLADVSDGIALHERGAHREAATLLGRAVDAYVDEPFADNPYDDQTTALRDEARAAYLRALRLLAETSRRASNFDEATGYLRRHLEVDRYDEDAHRTLIGILNRCGRHGQARSAIAAYRTAMADLGLRPTG